jgi:hypothetical protein
MATVPDHNAPEVRESEVKVFRQKYYIVDDEEDTGRRTDYTLHEARVEVMADDDGVFLEAKEGSVTEQLSIPTSDLAVSVAKYILGAYGAESANSAAEDSTIGTIKFLTPKVQDCIAHELWRLSNHITSPHGPVDAQGSHELYGHLKYLSGLLDIKPAPHPDWDGRNGTYRPDYNRGL